MKKCLVVIPTYNEAGNIEKLIKAIFKVDKSLSGWRLDILVADDNSPDGTGKIVKKLQAADRRIYLSNGQKGGLGKAYIRGLKYGLRRNIYQAFIMMDADFSHDPAAIPSLLKGIDNGGDYIIGSRYVAGGGVVGWPAHRKVNSHTANFLARVMLDMNENVRDLTGGFKAIRVSALKAVDLDSLRASGYVFIVSLLHEFAKRDFIIREVPITFSNRREGVSKIRLRDVLEFIYITYRLNPESRARRLIRFGLVGASGTLVNLAVLAGLVHWTNISVLLADAVAIETSVISNFILNHSYTFRAAYTSPRAEEKDPFGSIIIKLVKYNLITLGGAAISFAIFVAAYKWLNIHYLLSDLVGIILAMAWNYWLSVKIVWKVVDEI